MQFAGDRIGFVTLLCCLIEAYGAAFPLLWEKGAGKVYERVFDSGVEVIG